MTKDAPGGATLRLLPMQQRRTIVLDATHFLTVIVTAAGTVGLNLFSSWLWDRLTNSKIRHIRINRRIVEVTPEGIQRAIQEPIEIEEK
jgi:hypothetical protein